MGNRASGHACARLAELTRTVDIEKGPDEGLGLNMKGLVVTNIDDPSAAMRHGCGAYIGQRLLSVNGTFVGSAADVRELCLGQTCVSLRFVPKELPLTLEKRWNEPLGLVFSPDNLLVQVNDGSAGKRCNSDNYIGLKLVSINGLSTKSFTEIDPIWEHKDNSNLILGFSIPLPDPAKPATVSLTKQQRAFQFAAISAREISVHSPNKWQHCSGRFVFSETERADGYPVWEKLTAPGDQKKRWMYTTPQGFWRVTDSTADFSTGAGYIISAEKHDGRLPHEIPMWQTKGYMDDPEIVVKIEESMDQYQGVSDDPPPKVGEMIRVLRGDYDGKCGIVVKLHESSDTAEVNLSGSRSQTVIIPRRFLHTEPERSSMLWKSSDSGEVGLIFTDDPSSQSELILSGVVPNSIAEKYACSDYTGYKLLSVCNKSVSTPADIAEAVSGTKLLKLMWAAPEVVEATPLFIGTLELEECLRDAIIKEEHVASLWIYQLMLDSSAHIASKLHTRWCKSKQTTIDTAQKAVDDGKGLAGCIEAISTLKADQFTALIHLKGALAAGEEPLLSGAVLHSSFKNPYNVIKENYLEYIETEVKATELSDKFNVLQEKTDDLDDDCYRTKRQLARKPSDLELQNQLLSKEKVLSEASIDLELIIRNMKVIADVTPQLYGYILPYEQSKDSTNVHPESSASAASSPSPVAENGASY
eukprot:TRINITY_DN1315_c0_g2_i1.p1 TRINITY_DN1315_c0_g2~~TRINITY_DN1315_c0_g2_i1.p1  ORF type:complete len:725 (+),score=121.78 TRINITY_DN1315_c0_g2_i1:78-2177(+)